MRKSVFSAALLLLSSASIAQAQPPAQQQASADDPRAASRVICRDEGEIGSRLARHRVCMTADQWKQRQQEDRDNTAEQQRKIPN